MVCNAEDNLYGGSGVSTYCSMVFIISCERFLRRVGGHRTMMLNYSKAN